jgi:hypothetical protein
MELILLLMASAALWYFNNRDQQQRVRLLAGILGQFQVEKLMETVVDGYLRALGETDPDRSKQVWNMLGQAETTLCEQLQAFVTAFDKVDATEARWSTLPLAIPFAAKLFPRATADFRALLRIHAAGVDGVVRSQADLPQKDRAFMLTAELLLLQHSCHWFCRSKALASARTMARHHTPYTQALASVSPATRTAYRRLVG